MICNVEEIFHAEEVERSTFDTFHHQLEFCYVGGNVLIANCDKIAEDSAVRTDGDLCSRRVEDADFTANLLEKTQRDLLSHIRQAPEDLLRIWRLCRERG